MTLAFQNVLAASFSGSVIIILVILLRQLLKKAPRWMVCLLWLLVCVRLLCPFELKSNLSLQPDPVQLAQSWTEQMEPPEVPGTAGVPAWPEDAVLPEDVQITVNSDAVTEVRRRNVDWEQTAAVAWAIVAAGLALYSAAAYLKLKFRVREAVKLADNVYECAGLDTAFVLGYLRPRIYIPMGLAHSGFIVEHERCHIRRGDHWFKLAMFAALTLHWFNPLVWCGYLLLCRDLEMACDERVIRDLDLTQRKAYSAALLACSADRRSIAACPVAFGEVSVKQRIMGILHYRRPRFWLCVAAAAAVIFVAVCFLTGPRTAEQVPDGAGENQTAEEGPLDKCKAALDAFRSSEAGHVTVTWEHEGDLSLNQPTSMEFWKKGDAWFSMLIIDDAGVTKAALEAEGVQYEGLANGGYSGGTLPDLRWKKTTLTDEAYYKTWLDNFDFDVRTAELLDYQAAMGDEMISFRIPTGEANGLTTECTVTFELDGGILERAVCTATVTGDLAGAFVAQRSTGTVNIVPIGAEEAAEVIEIQRRNAERTSGNLSDEPPVDGQTQLNKCREALEAFRNQEGYYYTFSNYTNEYDLGMSESSGHICVAPNGVLHVINCSDEDGIVTEYCLKYGNAYFERTTTEGDGGQTPWAEADINFFGDYWAHNFVWNPADITYVSTEKLTYGEAITVEVGKLMPESIPWNVPATLIFYVTEDGVLAEIRALLSFTGSGWTTITVTDNYVEDPKDVAAAIERYYQEAIG